MKKSVGDDIQNIVGLEKSKVFKLYNRVLHLVFLTFWCFMPQSNVCSVILMTAQRQISLCNIDKASPRNKALWIANKKQGITEKMKKLLMEDFRTKENLSVLFILGNGFDLNLGMKTSYTDVYNQYVQTESKSDVIKKFKEELNTNKTNKQSKWSDFELGMAKYARTLSSENELIECVWDFKGHMVEHLNTKTNA